MKIKLWTIFLSVAMFLSFPASALHSPGAVSDFDVGLVYMVQTDTEQIEAAGTLGTAYNTKTEIADAPADGVPLDFSTPPPKRRYGDTTLAGWQPDKERIPIPSAYIA